MKKTKDWKIINRQVVIIANALTKEYNNASLAFKQAWKIINERKIYTHVAGVSFNNRKAVLAMVDDAMQDKTEFHTRFEREPDNEFDKNAVKVNVYFGAIEDTKPIQLGYLPAEIAKLIAPLLDRGIDIKPHIYGLETWTARMVVWFKN